MIAGLIARLAPWAYALAFAGGVGAGAYGAAQWYGWRIDEAKSVAVSAGELAKSLNRQLAECRQATQQAGDIVQELRESLASITTERDYTRRLWQRAVQDTVQHEAERSELRARLDRLSIAGRGDECAAELVPADILTELRS